MTSQQRSKYFLQDRLQQKQAEPALLSARRLRTEYSPLRQSAIVDHPESSPKTAANFTKKRPATSKNMTVSGYYPLGMEFSSKGRYIPSTMRYSNSHSGTLTPYLSAARQAKTDSSTTERSLPSVRATTPIFPNSERQHPANDADTLLSYPISPPSPDPPPSHPAASPLALMGQQC